jgi:hypothetical protein
MGARGRTAASHSNPQQGRGHRRRNSTRWG